MAVEPRGAGDGSARAGARRRLPAGAAWKLPAPAAPATSATHGTFRYQQLQPSAVHQPGASVGSHPPAPPADIPHQLLAERRHQREQREQLAPARPRPQIREGVPTRETHQSIGLPSRDANVQ